MDWYPNSLLATSTSSEVRLQKMSGAPDQVNDLQVNDFPNDRPWGPLVPNSRLLGAIRGISAVRAVVVITHTVSTQIDLSRLGALAGWVFLPLYCFNVNKPFFAGITINHDKIVFQDKSRLWWVFLKSGNAEKLRKRCLKSRSTDMGNTKSQYSLLIQLKTMTLFLLR